MKKLKLLSAFMASVICIATALSGCSTPSIDDSAPQSTDAGTSTVSETQSDVKNPNRSDKRRTLKVMLFDRGVVEGEDTCDNNHTTKFMKESFGEFANADLEFVLVPRAKEQDKINIMMATKDAADVMFTYSRELVLQLAGQGGLAELNEYYDKSENLKAHMGETIKYGTVNGKIISLPGRDKNVAGGDLTVIRKEWLDKLGLEAPKTTEEFHQTMKTFKEKDPGGLGDKNYPFLMRAPGVSGGIGTFLDTITLLWSFVSDLTPEQDFTLPYWSLPGWKDGVRLVNQMYNEGLINPEFALDQNNSLYKSAIAVGNFGAITNLTGEATTSNHAKTLYKSNPDYQPMIIEPFVDKNGVAKKTTGIVASMYSFIPVFSKVPDLAVQYFDWMTQRDVSDRIYFGVEGQHYEMSPEHGIEIQIDPEMRPAPDTGKKEYWIGKDWFLLDAPVGWDMSKISIRNEIGLFKTYRDIDGNKDEKRAEFILEFNKASSAAALNGSFVDERAKPSYDTPMASVSKYQTNLDQLSADGFVKMVTAKAADFDKVYDTFMKEYLASGGQEIIDEKTAYFKERLAK